MARVNYNLFGITGISIRNKELSPQGNFLRWYFNPELGIPNVEEVEEADKGKNKPGRIYLYRRENKNEKNCKIFVNLGSFQTDPGYCPIPDEKEIVLNNLTISSDEKLRMTNFGLVSIASGKIFIRIKFPEPVHHVRVNIAGNDTEEKASAFLNKDLVAEGISANEWEEDRVTGHYFQLINRVFDEFLVPLDGTNLIREIGYSTVAGDCEEKGWRKIYCTFFPNPEMQNLENESLLDEIFSRLQDKFQNRYLVDDGNKGLYKDKLKSLLARLIQVCNPDESFINPRELERWLIEFPGEDNNSIRRTLIQHAALHPLHQRVQYLHNEKEKIQVFSTKPFYDIFLACLDPNIAYMLGLMYVDTTAKNGVHYDYMVRAAWGETTYCAVLYDLGAAAGKPVPKTGNVTYHVLKGTTWQGGKAKKRVGLNWNGRLNPISGPETPVLYDLCRDCPIDEQGNINTDNGEFITENKPEGIQPILCSSNNSFCYIDPLVPTGKHEYQVRGIDLFGRVSKWVSTGEFVVLDSSVPSPPVLVRAEFIQKDYLYPWTTPVELENQDADLLKVRWEWRYFQYRQAPAVDRFRVYFHQAPLIEEIEVLVRSSEVQADDEDHIKVLISRFDGSTVPIDSRFAGGMLSKLNSDGKPPAVKDRANYQVSGDTADIMENTLIVFRPPKKKTPGLLAGRLTTGPNKGITFRRQQCVSRGRI